MVEHLTFEELLEFNAMNYAEAREGTLAARVSTHIRTCAECRRALAAMQNIDAVISGYAKKSAEREGSTAKRKERLF